jgi:hypothetical protein
MKANRAYDLIVSRDSREPAFLANADRLDRIEVVSIDDGEVALFWELAPKDAAKLLRALRTDLAQLEAGEFITAWEGSDSPPGQHSR